MTEPTTPSDPLVDFMKAENVNDIVYAIAKRVRNLVDHNKMDDLRLRLCSDPEGRLGSAKQELIGMTRGDLIEAIITEDFIEEFPKALADD